MSTVLDHDVAEAEPIVDPAGAAADTSADVATLADPVEVRPGLTCAAVFLAVAGFGWMAGGVFTGFLPRLVGVFAAAVGTGLVALSFRTRRPSTIQSLGVPVAVLVGAALVVPFTSGGNANLPSLVLEAIRLGGAASPPIPFDPGWRFLLFTITSVLGTGAASMAIAFRKPQWGIFLPLPLILAASLAQAHGTPVLYTALAIALVPAGLTVAHGAELAREGATSGRFEARRLSRSAGVLVAMVAVMFVMSQIGLLPSDSEREQVVPPQRPPPPVALPDRPLFSVRSPRPLTWRFGVLDTYDGRGWLLAPYDSAAFRPLGPDGSVGAALAARPPIGYRDGAPPPPPPPITGETVSATFTIADLSGRVLPTIAGFGRVSGTKAAVAYDPRVQVLRLTDARASVGFTYTLDAPAPPTAAKLVAAGPPPASVAAFIQAPVPPPQVAALLQGAPAAPAFDRLQYVRTKFFGAVVAAGEGKAVDVPPVRVGEMLDGGEASPYEITAAEVLLARWAGVPARIGYGFSGGDRSEDGTYVVSPRHGATWLEAYFEGSGWVPILGAPAKAKTSIDNKNKQVDPTVQPSEDLAFTAYLPVRLTSVQFLFETIRYWLLRVAGVVILLGLVVAFYPALVKAVRRRRRVRWAASRGFTERIAVAYAELRDVANDLNVGDPVLTPIQFVDATEPDVEHEELAWLVSRALWGDLQRDLTEEDAEIAEDAARSMCRRLRRGQPPITRALALAARISLREPYLVDVPNLWPRWAVRRAARAGLRRRTARLRRRLANVARAVVRRPVLPLILLAVVVMASAVTGCGTDGRPAAGAGPALPQKLVPAGIGDIRFQQEPTIEAQYNEARPEALVDNGRIFTIRRGEDVLGGLQVASFKAGIISSKRHANEVRQGVLQGLGSGVFELQRVGAGVRVYEQVQREQKLYVWFDPDMRYFELLIAKTGFADAAEMFAAVLAFQQDRAFTPREQDRSAQLLDPRRGGLS